MINSIDLFRELFKDFIVGLVVFNEDNEIIHFNNSFFKMVKYNKDDLLKLLNPACPCRKNRPQNENRAYRRHSIEATDLQKGSHHDVY